MNARRFTIIAAGMLFTVGVAFGQTVGEKAPYFGSAETDEDGKRGEVENLEDMRGLMVVLFFFTADDPASTDAIDDVARLNRTAGVKVIGISPSKEADVKRVMEAKGDPISFTWESRGTAARYDVSNYPRAYIIDPSGIIAWRGHPGELAEQLKNQMRITPPIGADDASLSSKLSRAKTALSDDQTGLAFWLAKQVTGIAAEGTSLHNDATSLQADVEEKIKEKVAEARELITKEKYVEAADILASLKVRLEGHDLAKEIETEINRMRGSRQAKEIVEKQIRNMRAQVALEEALELLEFKRYVDANRSFRDVRDKFENTPAADTADAELKKIRSDEEMRKVIRAHYDEMQAENWLDIGNRYAKLELYDQARDYYGRITKEHPNSDAAKRAEKRLKDLPKS